LTPEEFLKLERKDVLACEGTLQEKEDLARTLAFADALALELDALMPDMTNYVPNKPKLERMKKAYACAKALVEESQCDITVTIEQPRPEIGIDNGILVIEGADISVRNMGLLRDILTLSDDVDICPLVDGRIQVNFGFGKLIVPPHTK
jgi:hypothetical protein